jgi:hypothetical protein
MIANYQITLDAFEHRLIVGGLNDYRNSLIREGRPTEDLNELILKLINAPLLQKKHLSGRDSR